MEIYTYRNKANDIKENVNLVKNNMEQLGMELSSAYDNIPIDGNVDEHCAIRQHFGSHEPRDACGAEHVISVLAKLFK